MAEQPETDAFSGVETTGHEWDGIKELNTPLPRWWLWTWYATIVWAIAYWIAMPAWPLVSDYTRGVLGYSQRATVAEDIRLAREAQSEHLERLAALEPGSIRDDPALLAFATAGGKSAFAVNCSQCHGTGAAGSRGYPNLIDDDWLWGGTVEAIHDTIRYGIRSGHDESRESDMPAFLKDEILTEAEVGDVTAYVLSLSGRAEDKAAAERGAALYEENCVACHMEGGQGNKEVGAPSLKDAIWLYGDGAADIRQTIAFSRRGVMPAWEDRLDPVAIKQLAVYVHALGGGE
ncbi:MAG: cytochrome-c oxidase, cbb3-type subunit III [Alphaproteobacteria bacterium]|nr:cytochrome-c oxidase, cbb3-type subunit III [Alphaproteobacteria bacterium]